MVNFVGGSNCRHPSYSVWVMVDAQFLGGTAGRECRGGGGAPDMI